MRLFVIFLATETCLTVSAKGQLLQAYWSDNVNELNYYTNKVGEYEKCDRIKSHLFQKGSNRGLMYKVDELICDRLPLNYQPSAAKGIKYQIQGHLWKLDDRDHEVFN